MDSHCRIHILTAHSMVIPRMKVLKIEASNIFPMGSVDETAILEMVFI